MGLSGTSRAKLHQVIVLLDKRHEAQQVMQLFLLVQLIRLIACAAEQQGDPLVLREAGPCSHEIVQVQVRHLNGLQRCNFKGRVVFGLFPLDFLLLFLVSENVFLKGFLRIILFLVQPDIFDLQDAPDPAYQQLLVVHHQVRRDLERIHAKVRKAGDILVLTLIKDNRDFIDDGVLPVLLDFGFYVLALVRTHIVLTQDLFDLAEPYFNGLLIIRCAVHTQQILQHVGGNICALFHQGGQVFSDRFPGEVFQYFSVKLCHPLLAPLEIKVVHKRNVNREFGALGHVDSTFLHDRQVVGIRLPEVLAFQCKPCPEHAVCSVAAGFVGNDGLSVADVPSGSICHEDLIGRRGDLAAHGFLLVEVQ